MEEQILHQREDIDVAWTITKKDGTPLNMGLAAKIYVMLYDGYREEKAKFKSGGAAAGWYLIDTTDAAIGILRFSILSEVTKELEEGRYYLEVLVQYNSATHTDDALYDVIEMTYAFTIQESQLNKLASLP